MVVEENITINHFIGFIEGHRFVSVNVVLISSLDRIGRDWGMTKQYIALLTKHKVKLLCLRERVSSDISGVSPFST